MESSNPKLGGQVQRSLTPSLMARRAREIQADEGVRPTPVYKPTGIADESDPIVTPQSTNSSHRGRARAGTLPSSWRDPVPTVQTSPSHPKSRTDFSAPYAVDPAASVGSDSTSSQVLVSGQDNVSPAESPYTAAQRLRSGSLTMPPTNMGNAFGPTFFSSNWQPARSGLSNMATAEEEQGPSPDAVGQYSFDAPDTLDYLGLADPSARPAPEDQSRQEEYLAAVNARNRALTVSLQPRRPRLTVADGRSRSHSILPSFHVETETDNASAYNASRPSASNAQGQSLLNAALHHRMQQMNPSSTLDAADLATSSLASRPRATSMGMMDRHDESPDTRSALSPYHDPEHPLGQAGYNSASLHAVAEAETMSMYGGRNRAGTIAAFSGPSGRQRTEQELLRMTHLQHGLTDARYRPLRPSSAGVLDQPTSSYESMGPRAPVKPYTVNSGSSSPFLQPTRSLYVGLLRSNVTTQELLQVFSRYGAVETFRFVPDKECAFINYVEIADAVRAKDDINNRLGGHIGLGSASSDGFVRVKFGRPESAPLASTLSGTLTSAHDGVEALGRGPDMGCGSSNDVADSMPTRALWIGSIPATTSIESLVSIFAPFGPIESVRVLSGRNCGFVNFERLDDAVIARKALHGRDVLGPEVGSVRIGFAKVPNRANDGSHTAFDPYTNDPHAAIQMLSNLQGAGPVPAEVQLLNGHLEDYRSNLALDTLVRHATQPTATPSHPGLSRHQSYDSARGAPASSAVRSTGFPTHSASNSIVPSSDRGGVPLPAEMKPRATVTDLQLMMQQLDDTDVNVSADVEMVAKPRPLTSYYTRIPPVAEVPAGKMSDNSSRLKEARKRLESSSCSQFEADNLARELLGSIVELSSDFIGNTLVQKFFERCSETMKGILLARIGPHLATIGVHKNGTWAAQKIIDCTQVEDQRALVVQHLRPYVPPLLLDQYGNYVVQKLIPFGSPYCDFIFDAMVDRCWEIAQGRFGARSMRTCLETAGLPKAQIKRVAISIILNSVPLATSQNGALLITWLLDASGLPGRFRLLAPRLTPHLAHLCTHKLASQTVHRIISQRVDLDASHMVLRTLCDPSRPQLLEEILIDQVHGSQFITKLLLDPQLLDAAQQERFSDEVRKMLIRHKLVHVPPYKPLAASLGLLSAEAVAVKDGPAAVRDMYDASASLQGQQSQMSLESFNYSQYDSTSASAAENWGNRGNAPVVNGRVGGSAAFIAAPTPQVHHPMPVLGLSDNNGLYADSGYRTAPAYANQPSYQQQQLYTQSVPQAQPQHPHHHQLHQQQSYPRRHSPLVHSSQTSFGN